MADWLAEVRALEARKMEMSEDASAIDRINAEITRLIDENRVRASSWKPKVGIV